MVIFELKDKEFKEVRKLMVNYGGEYEILCNII